MVWCARCACKMCARGFMQFIAVLQECHKMSHVEIFGGQQIKVYLPIKRPSEWIRARSLNSYFAFCKIVVKINTLTQTIFSWQGKKMFRVQVAENYNHNRNEAKISFSILSPKPTSLKTCQYGNSNKHSLFQ